MSDWKLIETAPKDGTLILVLSKGDTIETPFETIVRPPKAALAFWNPDADAWCDEHGRFKDDVLFDSETMALFVTGCWMSGGGWFQPNEVTHWMPIPPTPLDTQ